MRNITPPPRKNVNNSNVFSNIKSYFKFFKRSKNSNVEHGRSMTEMLGVLAIIGVLSVGALIGYRYGISKYRANETINEINMHAMLISTAMTNGAEMPFGELPDYSRMGYPMKGNLTYDYFDYFEITIRDVQNDTCRRILESDWSWPAIIVAGIDNFAGDMSVCDIEGDKTKMTFVFETNLTEGSQINPDDKPKLKRCNTDIDCLCGSCMKGICKTDCPTGASCVKNYEDARYYQCCLNDFVVNGYCCAGVMEGKCCNSAGNCCPPETPLQDKNGNCYACDVNQVINVSGVTENCYICPERSILDSQCILPCDMAGTPTEGKPLMSASKTCYACDHTVQIEPYYPSDCDLCPNRTRYYALNGNKLSLSSWCAPRCDPNSSQPLLGADGYCHDCNYTGVVPVQNLEGECSALCPNRYVGGDNNAFCVLDCSTDKPLKGADGKCYACNTVSGVDVTRSTENCSVCDTSATPRQVYTMGSYEICAMPCDVAGTPTEGKPLQINSSLYYVSNKGQCVGCTENINVKMASQSECQTLCPNRTWFPYYQYASCMISTCSGNTPLRNTNDSWHLVCASCDYEQRVLNSAQSDTCENLCPGKRVTNGDYCVLANCDGFFTNINRCYACDDITSVSNVTQTECNKCPERVYQSGRCTYPCGQGAAADKALMQTDGNCYSCNTKSDIKTTEAACNVCENRTWENNYCKRNNCANGYFLGSDGECYPCNYSLNVAVDDQAACDVCMNRKLDGSNCVL